MSYVSLCGWLSWMGLMPRPTRVEGAVQLPCPWREKAVGPEVTAHGEEVMSGRGAIAQSMVCYAMCCLPVQLRPCPATTWPPKQGTAAGQVVFSWGPTLHSQDGVTSHQQPPVSAPASASTLLSSRCLGDVLASDSEIVSDSPRVGALKLPFRPSPRLCLESTSLASASSGGLELSSYHRARVSFGPSASDAPSVRLQEIKRCKRRFMGCVVDGGVEVSGNLERGLWCCVEKGASGRRGRPAVRGIRPPNGGSQVRARGRGCHGLTCPSSRRRWRS